MLEKRKFIRVKPKDSLQVRFKETEENDYHNCFPEDISLGGIGIRYFCDEEDEISNALGPDKKLVVELRFSNEKVFEINSHVRWVIGSKTEEGKCKLNLGLEFEQLEEENKEFLENYIKDILNDRK